MCEKRFPCVLTTKGCKEVKFSRDPNYFPFSECEDCVAYNNKAMDKSPEWVFARVDESDEEIRNNIISRYIELVDKPKHYNRAFTYEPKIEGVLNGTITQTIRAKGKSPVTQIGDTILFHGWKGKPYNSGWSWRLKVKPRQVIRVFMYEKGFYFINDDTLMPEEVRHDHPNERFYYWKQLDYLAKLDGISPPTGEEMGKLLISMVKKKEYPKTFQIIRW